MPEGAYLAVKPSRLAIYDIRDAAYAVRSWGPESGRPLVLLHGTRDTSATFQFLVDALQGPWRIVAPDWRGHGQTRAAHYGWFHDYLVDLDRLLQILFADRPVDLIGHSLGGNVATVFAGLRCERIRHVVSLDAFGTLPPQHAQFPELLLGWLRRVEVRPPATRYESIEQMARRLCAANRRLDWDKALFLAIHTSRASPAGGFEWQFDSFQRRSMPTFHSLAEWLSCWRRITARQLWVAAEEELPGTVRADPQSFALVREQLAAQSLVVLADTGHNIQHDAPGPLAALIEAFLRD